MRFRTLAPLLAILLSPSLATSAAIAPHTDVLVGFAQEASGPKGYCLIPAAEISRAEGSLSSLSACVANAPIDPALRTLLAQREVLAHQRADLDSKLPGTISQSSTQLAGACSPGDDVVSLGSPEQALWAPAAGGSLFVSTVTYAIGPRSLHLCMLHSPSGRVSRLKYAGNIRNLYGAENGRFVALEDLGVLRFLDLEGELKATAPEGRVLGMLNEKQLLYQDSEDCVWAFDLVRGLRRALVRVPPAVALGRPLTSLRSQRIILLGADAIGPAIAVFSLPTDGNSSVRFLQSKGPILGAATMDEPLEIEMDAQSAPRGCANSTPAPAPLPSGKVALEQSDIMQVLVAYRKPFNACYRGAKTSTPSAHGTIVMRWMIRPDGGATAVEVVAPERNNSPAAACLASMIAALRFPAYTGPQMAPTEYPFKF